MNPNYAVDGSEIITKTNSDGKIYQVSVYNKTLNPSDVVNNYLQSSRSFDTTNNAGDYTFSVSAGSSIGGYGGGY